MRLIKLAQFISSAKRDKPPARASKYQVELSPWPGPSPTHHTFRGGFLRRLGRWRRAGVVGEGALRGQALSLPPALEGVQGGGNRVSKPFCRQLGSGDMPSLRL